MLEFLLVDHRKIVRVKILAYKGHYVMEQYTLT